MSNFVKSGITKPKTSMSRFNPLKKIKLIPLAFDSYGVRSMATYVETPDSKVLIDPGAALGPVRFKLPPAIQELQALKKAEMKIKKYAKKSEILIISHYHYDHYMPEENIYMDKILYIKHPEKNINKSQIKRAADFLKFISNYPPKIIEFADAKTYQHGRTTIKFSPAVHHGDERSRLGYVLMCAIGYGTEKLIHASDVQGPQVNKTTDWIIKQNPDVLILSGFPTLFLGWKASAKGLQNSNKNLTRIMKKTKVKTIILDHHITREPDYVKKIQIVYDTAERLGKFVVSAAEFAGDEPNFLESHRRELWELNKGKYSKKTDILLRIL